MWYLNSTNFKLSTCIILLIQFFLVNQWMYTVTLIKRRSNKNYQWNCKTLPLQRIRKRPSNPPPKTNKHKHPPPKKKPLKMKCSSSSKTFEQYCTKCTDMKSDNMTYFRYPLLNQQRVIKGIWTSHIIVILHSNVISQYIWFPISR